MASPAGLGSNSNATAPLPPNGAITATTFCPPNSALPSDNGGWCNSPRCHFDFSMTMFIKLVKNDRVGTIPVMDHRVPCVKFDGKWFEINGNPNWNLVLAYNVGGAGDVVAVSAKGSNTGWIQMSKNRGQNWETGSRLLRQCVSFRVTASDGKVVEYYDVAPSNWQFGQNLEGKQF